MYLLLDIFHQSLIAIALEIVCSWYFLEGRNFCFATKNFSGSTDIYVFFSKKQQNWFFENIHNSGMVDRRKLGDRSLNCIFNAVLIGLQNAVLFERPDLGLKCLVTVMPKGQ